MSCDGSIFSIFRTRSGPPPPPRRGKKKKFSRFVPLIGQKHTQGNNDPRSIIYNIFNRTSYIYVYIGVSYMYNRANRFLITIKWSKNWRGGRGGGRVININRQNGSGSKMMRVNLKISQRSFPSLSREKKESNSSIFRERGREKKRTKIYIGNIVQHIHLLIIFRSTATIFHGFQFIGGSKNFIIFSNSLNKS